MIAALRRLLGGLGLSVWLQKLYNSILTHVPSNTLRLACLRLMGADIGEGVWVMPGCRFLSPKLLHVGPHTHVGRQCLIDSRGGLEIGSNVVFGMQTAIFTADHDPDDPDFAGRNQRGVIGDRVWLASRCTVVRGAELGEGVVAAAGTVITKSVPPFTIVGGSPAVSIRRRSEDLRYIIKTGRGTEL